MAHFLSIASACGAFGQFYTSLADYSKRGIPRHIPLPLAYKQEDQVMIAAQFFYLRGQKSHGSLRRVQVVNSTILETVCDNADICWPPTVPSLNSYPWKTLHFCHERTIKCLTHEGLEPNYGNKFMIQIFMDGKLVVVDERPC